MEDLGHRRLCASSGDADSEWSEVRILQVTDLHHFPSGCKAFDVRAAKGRVIAIGEGTCYSTHGDLRVIASILERVQPHLVVLTGDIFDGRLFADASLASQCWRECLLEVLEPIVAFGCAWTFVPGNHDDDGGPWKRDDLLAVYRLGELAPGCISEGATSFDHTLSVGFTERFCAKTSLRLWLFDSGGNHEDERLKYYTFSAEAVRGYCALSDSLPPAAGELAYFHIPLPQASGLVPVAGSNNLFDAALSAGMVPRPWRWQPFRTVARLLGKDLVVGASALESGLFEEFIRRGRVRACFFGHDHASDAVFVRSGLFMAYGRVGGTTPPVDWEGDAGPLPFEVGARLVAFCPGSCRGDIRTAIELAQGRQVGSELLLQSSAAPGAGVSASPKAPSRLRRLFSRLLFPRLPPPPPLGGCDLAG